MELKRRGFLKGVGALGGVAATGFGIRCNRQDCSRCQKGPQERRGIVETSIKKIKSGCAICPNFCGIEATVVNGIVRTIYRM